MSSVTLIATNVFIVAYLLLAWCWDLPSDHLANRLIFPFRKLILYVGLGHGWSMFGDPLRANRKLKAIVHFADGTTEEWLAPCLSEMNVLEAFLRVRELKFEDNLLGGKMAWLKPALCEFLLREFAARGTEPVKIELVRLQQPILPPEKADQTPPQFEATVIHVWEKGK